MNLLSAYKKPDIWGGYYNHVVNGFRQWGLVSLLVVLPLIASCEKRTVRESPLGAEKHHLIDLVTEKIYEYYVDQVQDDSLVEGALNGLLAQLDPYCIYLNQKNYAALSQILKGEFNGIGINVVLKKHYLKIISPIDGSPAAKAGIKAGDYITHIDGESLTKFTPFEAIQKLHGSSGTSIKLTIRRKKEPLFDVVLTRSFINLNPVISFPIENITYIRISVFNDQTEDKVREALEKFTSKRAESKFKGVILDLRNNPGGALEQAIDICRLFMDQGEIVSIQGKDRSQKQVFKAKEKDIIPGIPIVLLINHGSASAAEIVAGALQYHKRAIILGTTSFGKGSIQELIPLPGYGGIKLTVARFYTPKGEPIQDHGIIPDIEVLAPKERTLIFEVPATHQQSYETNHDPQLQRALDLLHGMALLHNNKKKNFFSNS